jgi:AraC-like DNA-binding protein
MRLPAAHYGRAISAALTVTGDPAFGLHMGEQVRSVMFDVVGPLLEQATTLRELFEGIGRYYRLLAVGPPPELHEHDASAWIRFTPLRGDSAPIRVIAEFVMTALLPALKLFVGHDAWPSRVSFAYQAPPYAAEYTRIFGGAERFGAAFTQMEVPRAWLDRSHSYGNPELYALLKAQADRTLSRLERDASLKARIEQVLARCGSRRATLQDIASSLHMSTRSLRRGLQAEGVSYVKLRTQHRIAEAKRMLMQPNASIQETAYTLGFDSVTAFHRAFKRWTGMTPMQYRSSC